MKKPTVLVFMLVLSMVFALSAPLAVAGKATPGDQPKPGKPAPDPDPDEEVVLTTNLSFPVVMTEYLERFYETTTTVELNNQGEEVERTVFVLGDDGNPIFLEVTQSITQQYLGSHPGLVDFDYGAWLPGDDSTTDVVEEAYWFSQDLVEYLNENGPWYPQPVQDQYANNAWQADTRKTADDELVAIDFIDWGNPLENISPTVGYRFPVEIALYQKLDETASMTAYKMACLEYQSSKEELFGTASVDGDFTWQSCYATVLTNNFYAEVHSPTGAITKVDLEPAIGPSGKMNFASAGGGWMPTVPGMHRIIFRVADPDITLAGAIVNNDEHYCMPLGLKMEDLSRNKLELTGVYGNETWIDVMVVANNSNRKK